MAYIGNGRTLLVLGSNVRDDIAPDGINSTFNLSQEVPGGYEGNVYVFKQTYITERLITGVIGNNTTTGISISYPGSGTNFTITTSNASIAAALSDIKETTKLYADANHTITISGSTDGQNNGTFLIVGCTYSGSSLTITLARTGLQGATPDTGSITLDRGYSGFWEVLEPETDYTIGGIGVNINKQITFTKLPKINDKIYVIHKGDATYNLVPSDNSVGPNQLSQNLREFSKQMIGSESPATTPPNVVNGTNTEFVLTQNAINSKAILVSVNGAIQEGEEWNGSSVTSASDYALRTDVTPNRIVFRTNTLVPPGAKIRVLHLGFSTVSRRSVLSPGQVTGVPNDSVGTAQLQNSSVTADKIVGGAVTNSKLADDSVTSNKILLLNNTSIRSFLSNGTTVQNVLSVGTDNVTNINAASQVSVAIAGTKTLNVTASEISSETTATQSLGSATKQFTNLHLSGTANAAAANVAGNITVGGTVDGVDISAFQTSVNSQISSLNSLIDTFIPIGTIVPYSGAASSGTLINGRWLLCDGSDVSRTAYPALDALFSSQTYPFGTTNASTFKLPDLLRRVPIGKRDTDLMGNSDGLTLANRTFTHTHSIPAHSHDMTHTHNLPGHYHVHDTAVGSNIQISVAGGSHTTTIDIGHTHSLTTNNNTVGLTANLNNANITFNDPGHGHNWDSANNTYHGSGDYRTCSMGEAYSITGFAATFNPVHGHTTDSQYTYLRANETTGSGSDQAVANDARALSSDGNNGATSTNSRIKRTAAHSHNVNGQNIDHWLVVRGAKTGCSISQTTHSHTVDAHSHTVNGGSFVGTSSHTGGTHTHASNTFSGNIGNVNSAVNGNVTGGTNITQSQSSTTTGLNTAGLTSGNTSNGVNTPYLIVNYIIRAL